MNSKLTAERLGRRAIIYVRQSTPGQVRHNQESQRRQYGLADRARELGFQQIEVVDEDLGRSGSGGIERPGFQRLLAEVCSGKVGAVLSIEASRLARNGRDWHHLIELCGLVDAVLIDADGIYDPSLLNDRLLLGLKGTMSEFEVSLFRQRSHEAILQKARRGEMQFSLPVGFCWNASGKIEKYPDARLQQAVELVFTKLAELGSARQVLLWFLRENVSLPTTGREAGEQRIIWKPPVYSRILRLIQNPIYAGAYAYGKTEARTQVAEGKVCKKAGYRKPRSGWTVLIRDHHPGYIDWAQFERNQAILEHNANMKSRMGPKAGRGGRALLAGLLRCRRCGHMLYVRYPGAGIRYACRGAHLNRGEEWCRVTFGGMKTDEAVARELLNAISGNAIEAALEAANQQAEQQQQRRQFVTLELEQARYEAHLAARRHEAVDPDNRLVAGELELRWNAALGKVQEIELKLQQVDAGTNAIPIPNKETLLSLAQDLPAVWRSPSTEMRLKQRIAHILIREIVADVDDDSHEIVLWIHWTGGRHSELRLRRSGPGNHPRSADADVMAVVRQMSPLYSDAQIAMTLNRLRLRTGAGNTFTPSRVYSLRHYHQLPAYEANPTNPTTLTLKQAAERLGGVRDMDVAEALVSFFVA